MLKAHKFRIYPNKHQKVLLAKHFGCSRFIYNWALNLKQKAYQNNQENLSKFHLANKLPEMKKDEETSWLKEVNSQTLQASIAHLDKAFTSFFGKNSKFPKFKSKHKSKDSFEVPQNTKVDFKTKRVMIPKFGKKGLRCHFSKEFEGIIKTSTISRNASGQYFISILVEDNIKIPEKTEIDADKTIGIDLGIKTFAVTSDGEKFENPKYLKKSEKKLRKAQRSLSHKTKGSNNRNKARVKVARTHQKISNQRTDFLHKLSTKLISENQTICLEDLNVEGMLKNHKLAKSISDASWSEFVRMLEYKAEWYGKNIIRIGGFEPSSKLCTCGVKNDKLTLKDREWTCLSCGETHDRDALGAWNIRTFGLVKNGIPLGQRKYMPVSYGSPLGEAEQESARSLA
jgi:putative transposase